MTSSDGETGLKLLCTDFDRILEKRGELFKGDTTGNTAVYSAYNKTKFILRTYYVPKNKEF